MLTHSVYELPKPSVRKSTARFEITLLIVAPRKRARGASAALTAAESDIPARASGATTSMTPAK